jgi:hypothetical protein
MERPSSLALIGQAHAEMCAGRFREAGRLALEAADAVESPAEADAVAHLAEECMDRCGFMQRGRFEAALEQVEESRALLAMPTT